jgi:hypothetical protein
MVEVKINRSQSQPKKKMQFIADPGVEPLATWSISAAPSLFPQEY